MRRCPELLGAIGVSYWLLTGVAAATPNQCQAQCSCYDHKYCVGVHQTGGCAPDKCSCESSCNYQGTDMTCNYYCQHH